MELESGVVDQHVEAAQFLDDARHGIEAEAALGDVARDHQAATAFRFDGAPGDLGILGLIEMDDGDVGALAGEQHRHGAADAGIAAGDQGDLVQSLNEPFQYGASYIGGGSRQVSRPGLR